MANVSLSPERAEAIAATIRSLRAERAMSQERLAGLAGVTWKVIQRLESGQANPTVASLCAVADALGVSPRELLPR